MCLWAGYHLHHDTAKHGCSGVVKESTGEWNGALLSSLVRVGSVCMRVMADGHTRVWRRSGERHLRECIRPRHTGPTSDFMVWGAISYNSRSHFMLMHGKVNSAHFIAQVSTPCYCHFFDRKVMCFFSRTTHVHIRLLRRNVLFVMYNNCSGQQDPQISRQFNMYGTC